MCVCALALQAGDLKSQRMQLLPSLHILLSCSFILLLAYILSTIFSYLASSLLHGSSAKDARPSRSFGSSHRRSPAYQLGISEEWEYAQQDLQSHTMMDDLQEDDEEDDEHAYEDAEIQMTTSVADPAPTSRYELAGGIFDDGIREDVGADGYPSQADVEICAEEGTAMPDALRPVERWRDDGESNTEMRSREEEEQEEEAYAKGRYANTKGEESENGLKRGIKEEEEIHVVDGTKDGGRRGGAYAMDGTKDGGSVSGSGGDNGSGSGSGGGDNGSKLGDPQGSSSLQQRLPPTWSELEKMVNMNSKKYSSPSTDATLHEE